MEKEPVLKKQFAGSVNTRAVPAGTKCKALCGTRAVQQRVKCELRMSRKEENFFFGGGGGGRGCVEWAGGGGCGVWARG